MKAMVKIWKQADWTERVLYGLMAIAIVLGAIGIIAIVVNAISGGLGEINTDEAKRAIVVQNTMRLLRR